jgi:hypothetical protein
VETVGENCFENCCGITKVNLPNLKIIKENTFKNCSKLVYLNVPHLVEV